MSATIDFATVTNAIAALVISGVTVSDMDEIPEALGLEYSILAPRPRDFITDLNITAAEQSQQNLDVTYTLHYRYYHCAIGGGTGGLFSIYPAMIAKLALIVKAFSSSAVLAGAMNNQAPRIEFIGGLEDESSNKFHGCDISLDIRQFLEV
jgi:hypothetical protein